MPTPVRPTISIVVAMAEHGVIGRDNTLPWHLPADLQYFKRLTMGHPLIMGRRTFESIGRALPGRTSIVLSRSAIPQQPRVLRAESWEDALRLAGEADSVMVIGGRSVYQTALGSASRIYLTRVHAELEGDVRFPDVDWSEWQLTATERHSADARNQFDYSFEVYERLDSGRSSSFQGKRENLVDRIES